MEKLKNILFNKVTIGAILLFVQLALALFLPIKQLFHSDYSYFGACQCPDDVGYCQLQG